MIIVECGFCGHRLKKQGALLFSPPSQGLCNKLHICDDCYYLAVLPLKKELEK